MVYLLPAQSNDEVCEVFAPVEGAGDDSLYYSLDRPTFFLWQNPPRRISQYRYDFGH